MRKAKGEADTPPLSNNRMAHVLAQAAVIVKELHSASSALQHGRLKTACDKVALVNRELSGEQQQSGSLRYTGEDEECNDYVLEQGNAFITVGPLTVYIRTRDAGASIDGVIVEVIATGAADKDFGRLDVSNDEALCPHCRQHCFNESYGTGCEAFLTHGFAGEECEHTNLVSSACNYGGGHE